MIKNGYLIRKLTDEEMKILSDENRVHDSLNLIYNLIGNDCQNFELAVYRPFQMLVDEEGWVKRDAKLIFYNEIASGITSRTIAGNVLILPEGTLK